MGMSSVERVKEYLEIEQEAPAVVDAKRPPAVVRGVVDGMWSLVVTMCFHSGPLAGRSRSAIWWCATPQTCPRCSTT